MSPTALKLTQYSLAAAALGTLVAAHALGWELPDTVDALLAAVAGWLALMRPTDAQALKGR